MKTNYNAAKNELKEIAIWAKSQYIDDLPAINMAINDGADSIIRNGNLSEYQQNLLQNYACKLHPKKRSN